MSVRTRRWITAGLLIASSFCGPVQAGWWGDMWAAHKRDYYRNKAWPEPFLQADRDAVAAPFAVMAANGWQKHNLLGEPHFEEDGKNLTPAGVLKMRRILTDPVPEHRVIYIERGMSNSITATRVATMQSAAAEFSADGEPAPVIVSNMPVEGWKGGQVGDIFTKVRSTQPEPRLPSAQAQPTSSN